VTPDRLVTGSARPPLTETVRRDRAMRRIDEFLLFAELASNSPCLGRSFRAWITPSLKADFIGVDARRRPRLTTDPRMVSANMAGDRVDAHNGLRSRNRGV
jgi:hypothetical protein